MESRIPHLQELPKSNVRFVEEKPWPRSADLTVLAAVCLPGPTRLWLFFLWILHRVYVDKIPLPPTRCSLSGTFPIQKTGQYAT